MLPEPAHKEVAPIQLQDPHPRPSRGVPEVLVGLQHRNHAHPLADIHVHTLQSNDRIFLDSEFGCNRLCSDMSIINRVLQ
eukprot:1185787-Amphidinium_carterae.1